MDFGLPGALSRRSWWWVFGLLIALPALALALLGFDAIRADDLSRRQQAFEQQQQTARMADVALASAFERVAATFRAPEEGDQNGPRRPADDAPFEVGAGGVIAFVRDRVRTGAFEGAFSARPDANVAPDHHDLLEQALAADAQGRRAQAAALYRRLRDVPAFRRWVDLQMWQLQPEPVRSRTLSAVVDPSVALSDGCSPSGIPLAVVASSLIEAVSPPDRHRFLPLLQATLSSLRSGRWWLRIEGRRAYDEAVRRWLMETDPAHQVPEEARLDALERFVPDIVNAWDRGVRLRSVRPTAVGTDDRLIVVWPSSKAGPWRGVTFPRERAGALLASALAPLVHGQNFNAGVRGPGAGIWNDVADPVKVVPLESVPGWSLAFTDVSTGSAPRLLNTARIVVPILVLACGLVMTVGIVRRELALTRLQSAFVAGVTHEFKSPLTSIRLITERLARGRFPAEGVPERYFDAIVAETERLDRLVNRLLEVQALQQGERRYTFEPFAVETLVREAVESVRPQADTRNIQLNVQVAPGIPDVPLDRDAVVGAVRNLVDNAVKYSPEASSVEVAVASDRHELAIDVSDEGIGVEPAEAERIFEPFYRSSRGDRASVHGTGLGLALVQTAARAHGGSVRVSRNGSTGSRFTLVLPLARGDRAINHSVDAARTSNLGAEGPAEPSSASRT